MRQYLETLEDGQSARSIEEYLGAFTESFKIILCQNPVERMGHAVLLAAKTALRLKAVRPGLKEHEIARRLQAIARNLRLTTILNDLTPEEKGMLQLHPLNQVNQYSCNNSRVRRTSSSAGSRSKKKPAAKASRKKSV